MGLTTRVGTHSRRESGLDESRLTTSRDSRRLHDESQTQPQPGARDVTVPTLGDVGEPTTMVTTTTTTTTTMLTFRARARGAGATSLTSPARDAPDLGARVARDART